MSSAKAVERELRIVLDPETREERSLLGRARGRDDVRAAPFRDLDGGEPDAARGAVDQDPIAGLEPAQRDEAVIGGQERHRHAGSGLGRPATGGPAAPRSPGPT